MKIPAAAWPLLPLLAACGCASPPPPEAAAVRSEYEATARLPEVSEHAALQLRDANATLRRLETTDPGDEEEVAHLAYLTRQQIQIAKVAGETGATQERIERAGEERNEVRLEARERELGAARAEAMAARAVAASAIERARELSSRIEELKAEETERGLVMTLSGVLFAFDSATLLPGAERKLQEVAALLQEYPDRRILVEGHTDSVGSEAYNERLSRERAEAVASVLRAKGVDPARLEVRGLGEAYPVAPNEEDAGRQANRRVAIVLLDGAPSAGAASATVPE